MCVAMPQPNTAENYFSILKRGHLRRVPARFRGSLAAISCGIRFQIQQSFRPWIEDGERAARALKGITGKRLTYRLAH